MSEFVDAVITLQRSGCTDREAFAELRDHRGFQSVSTPTFREVWDYAERRAACLPTPRDTAEMTAYRQTFFDQVVEHFGSTSHGVFSEDHLGLLLEIEALVEQSASPLFGVTRKDLSDRSGLSSSSLQSTVEQLAYEGWFDFNLEKKSNRQAPLQWTYTITIYKQRPYNGCAWTDPDFKYQPRLHYPKVALRAIDQVAARSGRRSLTYLRDALIEAHNCTCSWCGQRGTAAVGPDKKVWEIDHIVPKSAGGTDEWANLTLSCKSCNARKHKQDWGRPSFPRPGITAAAVEGRAS